MEFSQWVQKAAESEKTGSIDGLTLAERRDVMSALQKRFDEMNKASYPPYSTLGLIIDVQMPDRKSDSKGRQQNIKPKVSVTIGTVSDEAAKQKDDLGAATDIPIWGTVITKAVADTVTHGMVYSIGDSYANGPPLFLDGTKHCNPYTTTCNLGWLLPVHAPKVETIQVDENVPALEDDKS
eukprot:9337708-Pyramimonas_sp.AAC.1